MPSKKDKPAFDMVFENARLYVSYLGNASNPIILESVFMGPIFHNYKQLLQMNKEEVIKVNEVYLKKELISLINIKPEGKILFYRISKKWHGFLYSLHKEDRELLLEMILELSGYNESVFNIINIHDSQSPIDYLFFLFAIIQQQKLNDRLNKKSQNIEIATTNRTLADFM